MQGQDPIKVPGVARVPHDYSPAQWDLWREQLGVKVYNINDNVDFLGLIFVLAKLAKVGLRVLNTRDVVDSG